MRIMWDWSAGRWQGITDSCELALAHAESHLALGDRGRVKKVLSASGASTALGVDWTTVLAEHGPTMWAPFGWKPGPLALRMDGG
jgi:hypothetical protein